MADKGIDWKCFERLRDYTQHLHGCDAENASGPDGPSCDCGFEKAFGAEVDAVVSIRNHIEALRAEIARLTEGAIEGWAIPIEHEHPLLKEWLVSSHPVTGLGEREQRPCKLIIDTQGEDE